MVVTPLFVAYFLTFFWCFFIFACSDFVLDREVNSESYSIKSYLEYYYAFPIDLVPKQDSVSAKSVGKV